MQLRLRSIALLLAFSGLATACNFCGADEERAITVSTTDSLTITRAGTTKRMQLVSRVGQSEIDAASFNAVFDAVERGASGNRAMLLTLSNIDQATNELTTIVLAIPVNLQRGSVFNVVRTFNAEPGLSTDPGMWGVRELQAANTAEIGFTTSIYSFPPATHTITYRATGVSGTVRVTQRQRGYIELQLDIQMTDAVGGAAALNGRVQINTERYTPSCT